MQGKHRNNRMFFFVGLPGVGKTYWGKQVAQEHGLHFIDLDDYITGHEQLSIGALFDKYSEIGFREIESRYLHQVIGYASNTLIACGGGTPCSNGNMEVMKAAGTVIFLDANINTIAENIQKDILNRPLLKNVNNIELFLNDIRQKRLDYYKKAHHFISVDNASVSIFAEIISSCTDLH